MQIPGITTYQHTILNTASSTTVIQGGLQSLAGSDASHAPQQLDHSQPWQPGAWQGLSPGRQESGQLADLNRMFANGQVRWR